MSFETTVRVFATALADPSAATPAMTQGRMGAPDARRFAVYRNNVAVGLIGAIEARYPVSRRIAGDDLFRAMARGFVRTHRPRTPVMIAYGEEFPEFVADYLARVETEPAFEWNRHREEPRGVEDARLSTGFGDAAIQSHHPRPSPLDRFAYARDDEFGSAQLHHGPAYLPDVARLENAWVEAYHSQDAAAATVADLAALNPDCLPGTRIAFHPAARFMRFATPAASVWASAQSCDQPAAPTEGTSEDALITRPDCEVRVRVLPPLAYDFALSLREGATLVEAVAAVNDPAFDFGAHLVGLVESGAVASIIPGRSS
jgi:Putative DNA-binding domain